MNKSFSIPMISCLLSFAITGFSLAGSSPDWRKIQTAEALYQAYPEIVEQIFESIDLDHENLEHVKTAYQQGDIVVACELLLDYYKKNQHAAHYRNPIPVETMDTDPLADTILNNVFVVQNVRGQVPFGDDGHRDWYYKGPNDDREWAWLSNRHSQINYVLSVFFETGNPKYIEYIDLFLRDFIIKSMPYPAEKSSTSIWRGLEVAARAKVWSRIFYSLMDSEYLSPATRLLMLSSLSDHAYYNRNFHAGNNWLTMEISALATVATNFPEYRQSKEWLVYSIATMTESMKGQVYADGVQTELTSHYHNVSMFNFELFKDICDRANAPLPDFFNQTIEAMYSYIAHAVRPDGYRALNNDGDRGSDREIILSGAKKFNNNEWEYIASNGNTGTKPLDGPSYFYPWAGQLISRSGYDADAHWSFFDVGPWGSGHQHNDKLHISISAFGRDLLVDAGRFAYTGEVAQKFRNYARGSQGHNVLLIDGKGQGPGIEVVTEPLGETSFKIEPDYDFATGDFDAFTDVQGKVSHSRSVMYVRGHFWVALDHITTDRPRQIESLWHWHPECEVQLAKQKISTTVNAKGNLMVVPVGKNNWKVAFEKGVEGSEMQGWYSPEYNKFEPNTASVYTTKIKSDQNFIWLLVPFETDAPELNYNVVAENDDSVTISVSELGTGSWDITIPIANNKQVELDFAPVSK